MSAAQPHPDPWGPGDEADVGEGPRDGHVLR